MENLFSIGELAKYQKISKQTLIFYDKIGLFRPAYVDPDNGYRYYSAAQLDFLDTILIMKKIGFSLKEIQAHMQDFTIDSSLVLLRSQLARIDREIAELSLIRSRLALRCDQMERANASCKASEEVRVEDASVQYLLYEPVQAPFSFAAAFQKQLPIFFQSGVVVPLERIRSGDFTQASQAFVLTENTDRAPNIRPTPSGQCVSLYHFGLYASIGRSYRKLLDYCARHGLEIVSDSYEFCINDYLSSNDESEYITKIMLFVR